MHRQNETMKNYAEKAEELVALTLDVCEQKLAEPAKPTQCRGKLWLLLQCVFGIL